MDSTLTYKRRHLAKAYCDSLQGRGITNATSGLFLSGPRRVGKSTFLIEDLIPEAEKRGWITIYVDLWANKLIDPALLIIEAIKSSLLIQKNRLRNFAKKIQLQKISILQTITLDFTDPGLPDNVTLTDALKCLMNLTEKPILLIIDEAQAALTTEHGMNTMFALKSARDQMNLSRQTPGLMLTFTGSNRDKLAQLVTKKENPFFGANITSFPLLGRDYTDFFTEKVNGALAPNNQFDKDSIWEAFQFTGHRPEILRQLVSEVAISHDADSFSRHLKEHAFIRHSKIWSEFENDYHRLTPLQQCILSILVQKGREWSPFSEASMNYYQQQLKEPNLSVSTVQTAIQSLREQDFIWQSSRGSYALEDESFGEWLKHRDTHT